MVDSAGVVIAVNRPAANRSENPRWLVGPEEALSIGALDGPPEYLFSAVVGAVQMPDGRIAVADAGNSSVRFFSPHGRFLGSSGRSGRGPGEFADIAYMGRLSVDTLVLWDGILQRMTVLDGDGRYVRQVVLQDEDLWTGPAMYNVAGVDESGTILAFSSAGRGMVEGESGTLVKDSLRFVVFDREGASGRLLGTWPARPRVTLRTASGVTFPYLPLTAPPQATAGSGALIVAAGSIPEFRRYESSGGLRGVVRWEVGRRSGASEAGRLQDFLLSSDRSPAQRSASQQLLAVAPLPDSLPVAGAVVIDRAGNVWVERYRAPWETDAIGTWDVFGDRGEWLGAAQVPPRVRIHEIGGDYVLVTWRDSMNVQFIRLYPLRQSPS